jgi:hypothetical protein
MTIKSEVFIQGYFFNFRFNIIFFFFLFLHIFIYLIGNSPSYHMYTRNQVLPIQQVIHMVHECPICLNTYGSPTQLREHLIRQYRIELRARSRGSQVPFDIAFFVTKIQGDHIFFALLVGSTFLWNKDKTIRTMS